MSAPRGSVLAWYLKSACPYCNAKPGERCRTKDGKVTARHNERRPVKRG